MNPFREEDYQELKAFIQKYDDVHVSIETLESILQTALAEQKKCVEQLESIRRDEEEFFLNVSKREDFPVAELKKLATSWAMKKNENFFFQPNINKTKNNLLK